jgi:hypothetical protein
MQGDELRVTSKIGRRSPDGHPLAKTLKIEPLLKSLSLQKRALGSPILHSTTIRVIGSFSPVGCYASFGGNQ